MKKNWEELLASITGEPVIKRSAPTASQQNVIDHRDGPAVVFAPPGSGKTTTLLGRVKALVDDGVKASKILVCTFSKINVEDARRKLHPSCKAVNLMTWHGLGLSILKLAVQLGEMEKFKVLSNPRPLLQELAPKGVDLDELETYISREKAALRLPGGGQGKLGQPKRGEPKFLEVFEAFEKRLEADGLVTYDDMIVKAYRLVLASTRVREAVQALFDHVMTDEYQDANLAQSELLDAVTGAKRNFMAIGDDDQAIYGWRNAESSYLRNFEVRYGATVFELEDNFRCRGEILAAARDLIRHNRERRTKSLSLTRGYGGVLSLEFTEGVFELVRDIKGDLSTRTPDELAILVRTYKQTPLIEAALLRAGIPYTLHGRKPFYAQQAAVDIVQRLQAALYRKYPPKGKWETKRAERCETHVLRLKIPDRDTLKLAATLEQGADVLIARMRPEDSPEVRGLLALAKGVSGEGFVRLLRRIAGEGQGRASQKETVDNEPRTVKSVALMTAFKAKGLEFRNVYIPNCDGDIYPGKGTLEEERRLFYVALTRAMDCLRIYTDPDNPSPFLEEGDPARQNERADLVKGILATVPATWSASEGMLLARLIGEQDARRYVRDFMDEGLRDAAAERVAAVINSLWLPWAYRRYGLEKPDLELWRSLAPDAKGRSKDRRELRKDKRVLN